MLDTNRRGVALKTPPIVSPDTTGPMYRVDDIAAAVEEVPGAGSTATDPQTVLYGISSTCTDDQGTRFFLGQLL